MSLTQLVIRSATYHWRTNLAVCLGVAAAVAVLGGALVTGDSVRGSLRELATSRLGATGHAITSAAYVRETLATEIASRASAETAPLIAATAMVTHEPSARRASGVFVYGIDARFWRFHGLEPREGVFVSPALAAELSAQPGDALLVRLQRPSEIPLESLFAQKEDVARTVRLSVSDVLPRDQLGEFSLQPQQAEVRAVFAPLARLQRELDAPRTVNTILVADGADDEQLEGAFRSAVALEDLGLRVSPSADRSAVIVEGVSGVVSEAAEEAARAAGRALGLAPVPVFTYLANTIRTGEREMPYSLVSGLDMRALRARQQAEHGQQPPARAAGGEVPNLGAPLPMPAGIVLNEWSARELQASVGDQAELEYYLWDAAAGLRTARTTFWVTGIVPMRGLAGDRRLAPEYPGITGVESVADWDPPFPLDLSRVRPQDEQYWDDYRGTPKAFIPYEAARDLWSTRYGRVTSLRFLLPPDAQASMTADALEARLRETVEPAAQGLVLVPTRRLATDASGGATNFGEYFTYFSFFIVVSALLLSMLFFRLGVEGRLRQIGILRASGFTTRHIRRMLLSEAAVLAVAGSLVGVAGAIGYAHLIVYGLTTWWVGAVGTTLLAVHVQPASLVAGAVGGIAAALACVVWSLRAVARRSPRALLGAYSLDPPGSAAGPGRSRAGRFAATFTVAGMALLTLGFVSPALQAGAFFGAGAALLIAILVFLWAWLRARDVRLIAGRGTWAVSRLGFRGAAFRPGRSVLSAALVASAAFIIVSVDAFRRGETALTDDPASGTGGFALIAESEVPIVHNPNDPAGRDALLLDAPELRDVRFTRFRLRPGEDASCLNLYRPTNPKIIAPEPAFFERRRFTFGTTLAESDDERANPWLLLDRTFDDGAVPVVADATSLQYVLHASVGDTMAIDVGADRPLTLRFVAALRDSVLQGEIVMGEAYFVRHFPGYDGFRYFLVDAPGVTTRAGAAALAQVLEGELQPFGLDAVTTADRLDAFHRVENTYLSTFQALGGLGLLLGTVGLATVMFRNVLERRRELALLRAVGYDRRHVTVMILAETLFILAAGLLAGAGCALVAIAPALADRGGSAPGAGLWLLLAGVLLAGVLSAAAATRAAVSGHVLQSLRAE